MQHGRPAPTTCRTKEAARYGMWGAVFVAGVTTLFVLLAIFGFSFMGIKPNALLDAVLFAGIAFGLSRYLPNRGRCTALLPPLTNRLSVSPLLATLTRMRGRGRVLCFPASCVCTDPVALLAPSSQRNPLDFGYNLRFALLALGPTSEVSG
jgi:hypothetical protein